MYERAKREAASLPRLCLMWDTEAGGSEYQCLPCPAVAGAGKRGALEMASMPVGLPGAQPALQGTILLRAAQCVCPGNLPL